MKYLVILTRFEIWLLLAVVGFVFYSAFRPEPKATEQEVLKEEKIAVVDAAQKTESTEKEGEIEPAETKQVTPNFRVESVRGRCGFELGTNRRSDVARSIRERG